MEKIHNFRDFGGYKTRDGHVVKKGLLYRSAGLSTATEGDLKEMTALGIKTVCDLRGQKESSDEPDRIFGGTGVRWIHAPINVSLHNARGFIVYLFSLLLGKTRRLDFGESAMEGYRAYVTKFRQLFSEIIKMVSDSNNLPILIHCKAGKDRTGFASSLILSLLGVPFETVMEDYLKSNVDLKEFREDTLRKLRVFAIFGFTTEDYLPLFDACSEYLQAAYDQIMHDYGTLGEYAHTGLGLTDDDLARLKSVLLEEEKNEKSQAAPPV